MATLSLTLPISCQICLGRVKDPVICSNNHAFCTACLDLWLQGNNCCPTCRVDITKDKPYRRVLGSGDNTDEMSFQKRVQLRKTRLELLGKEYETEIRNMNNEISNLTKENKRMKDELERRPVATFTPTSNNMETLCDLTKKLQEISATYDDVRRDMNRLQEEKNYLQKENDDLNRQIGRLKEEEKFTKSPKRYEKFTIIGLKAKLDQYEKENMQLRKALENRDQLVEDLERKLKFAKSRSIIDHASSQAKEVNQVDQSCTTSITNQDHLPSCSYSKAGTSEKSLEVKHNQSTSPRFALINQQNDDIFPTMAHEGIMALSPASNGDQSDILFPATRKLLELKKIHENRTSSTSPSPHTITNTDEKSPGHWSSCLQIPPSVGGGSSNTSADAVLALQINSPTTPDEQVTCALKAKDSIYPDSDMQSVATAPAFPEPESTNSNVTGDTNMNGNASSKRNLLETSFMNKKIKVEALE